MRSAAGSDAHTLGAPRSAVLRRGRKRRPSILEAPGDPATAVSSEWSNGADFIAGFWGTTPELVGIAVERGHYRIDGTEVFGFLSH